MIDNFSLRSLTVLSIMGQAVLLPVAASSSFSNFMLKLMVIAMAAYWALAGAIWQRRERGLSQTDLFLLKWGFFVMFPVVYVVAPTIAGILSGR